MKLPPLLNRELSPTAISAFVMIISLMALIATDYTREFVRLWDFQVYLKAKQSLEAVGSPYYDSESLRFIYPPSSIFILSLINESDPFKSAYFVLAGALWLATTGLFCRKPIQLLVVLPVFLLAFGKHGYVTILTGNIACILYFVAALFSWAYFTERISTVLFAAVILALTLIKPFYAEFLIFIWFQRDLRAFLTWSASVVFIFFGVNLFFYPELFTEFLSALKFENHDTEIFGITLMSHLKALGLSTPLSAILHFSLIGLMFALFLAGVTNMSNQQRFCCLFILAVFINPKHITYDLIVALPALTILLLNSRSFTKIGGFGIILTASVFELGLASELYFQWWYAYVLAFLMVLWSSSNSITASRLLKLIARPSIADNHAEFSTS